MRYKCEKSEADRLGFDAAHLIYHLRFWIRKNREAGINYVDGRYWTYCSKKALTTIFKMWSVRQVDRIIDLLVEKGIIVKAQYYERTGNATLWYAFVDERMIDGPIAENSGMDSVPMPLDEEYGEDASEVCLPNSVYAIPNGTEILPNRMQNSGYSTPNGREVVPNRIQNGANTVPNGIEVLQNRTQMLPNGGSFTHNGERVDNKTVGASHATVGASHATVPLRDNNKDIYTDKSIRDKEKRYPPPSSPTGEARGQMVASQVEEGQAQAESTEREFFLHLCSARLRAIPDFDKVWSDYVRMYNRVARERDRPLMDELSADNSFLNIGRLRDPIGALVDCIQQGRMRLYDVTTDLSVKRGAAHATPRITHDESPVPEVRYHENDVVHELVKLTIDKEPKEWWLQVRNFIRQSPEDAVTTMKLYTRRYPEKAEGLLEHFNFLVEREVINYPKLTMEELRNADAADRAAERATH